MPSEQYHRHFWYEGQHDTSGMSRISCGWPSVSPIQRLLQKGQADGLGGAEDAVAERASCVSTGQGLWFQLPACSVPNREHLPISTHGRASSHASQPQLLLAGLDSGRLAVVDLHVDDDALH